MSSRGSGSRSDRPDSSRAPKREENKIDRQKTTPLLLRVFTRTGAHHAAEDFHGKEPTTDEIQIYTWKDASLKELTDLIKGVKAAARARDARLSFAFVYPDTSGKNVVRQVGTTYASRRTVEDKKTLQGLRFETGDFLDVAIFLRE